MMVATRPAQPGASFGERRPTDRRAAAAPVDEQARGLALLVRQLLQMRFTQESGQMPELVRFHHRTDLVPTERSIPLQVLGDGRDRRRLLASLP